MIRSVFLILIMGLLINGCAQPPPPKKYHASNYKSDFGSRLDVAVNYHLQPDSGIVVIDFANPRNKDVRLWLVQTTETDGQRIIAARRFYQGTKKKHQEVFRIPLPESGLSESFYVEVFDIKGALIMTSEPINPSPKEGKP